MWLYHMDRPDSIVHSSLEIDDKECEALQAELVIIQHCSEAIRQGESADPARQSDLSALLRWQRTNSATTHMSHHTVDS